MKKAGFTGTRNGCTEEQYKKLDEILKIEEITELHHGDCIGADANAHEKASELGINIVIHPPTDKTYRAFSLFMNSRYIIETKTPTTHFTRNREIVNSTDILIAVPPTMEELSHGGTWYTINYARKKKKSHIIIFPDGSVQEERY